MSREINWIELDASIIKLNPMEQLMACTSLENDNVVGNEWMSLITPTSENMKCFVISLSNNAQFKFTDKIIDVFKDICEDILSKCSSEQIKIMVDDEVKKGNNGELIDAGGGMLQIIVPKNLLNYSKSKIENIFKKERNVVEENEWWLD